MSLILRQVKGSRLTIQEMDNNLLYLESLSGQTNLPQARIGSDLNYSQFDADGSLRFHGSATTYNDHPVDILTEVAGNSNPLIARIFRDSGQLGINYAQDFYSNQIYQYGTFNVSGNTDLINALSAGTFSISFWVNPTIISTTTQNYLFSLIDTGGTNAFSIYISSGARIIVDNNISGLISSRLNTGTWYHVCYTQSGVNGTLYLNNISTSLYSIPITNLYHTGYWACKKISTFIENPSSSSLSNLRLYNVLLTKNQVSQLYNNGYGLSMDYHPSGVTESTSVLFNFKNLESSGTTLYNSSTLGLGKNIDLFLNPNFVNGPIGKGTQGVYLPAFESTTPDSIGQQRSIRFEMSHDWKTGTPISLHMHVSSNMTILSGETIVFSLEYTIQDISMVLSETSLQIINSGRTYPITTTRTCTFSPNQNIPAYSNLILDFGDIDMSSFTTTSTSGIMTLSRLYGTFTGSLFEVQCIRMHYEIDSTGSRQLYIK